MKVRLKVDFQWLSHSHHSNVTMNIKVLMNMIQIQHFPCRNSPLSMGPCSTHSQRFCSEVFGFFHFFLLGDFFCSFCGRSARSVWRWWWSLRGWRWRRTIAWFLVVLSADSVIPPGAQVNQKLTKKCIEIYAAVITDGWIPQTKVLGTWLPGHL